MTTPWQKLAEARIRGWLQKPAAERDAGGSAAAAVAPLEVQLLEEIVRLLDRAAGTDDQVERDALRKQAAGVETRLLVLLESAGRSLAAQHFSRLIQEIRSGLEASPRPL